MFSPVCPTICRDGLVVARNTDSFACGVLASSTGQWVVDPKWDRAHLLGSGYVLVANDDGFSRVFDMTNRCFLPRWDLPRPLVARAGAYLFHDDIEVPESWGQPFTLASIGPTRRPIVALCLQTPGSHPYKYRSLFAALLYDLEHRTLVFKERVFFKNFVVPLSPSRVWLPVGVSPRPHELVFGWIREREDGSFEEALVPQGCVRIDRDFSVDPTRDVQDLSSWGAATILVQSRGVLYWESITPQGHVLAHEPFPHGMVTPF